MATLYNMGHQNFKWRKQLRSRCLIEAQQISFISATVAETRHHPIVLFPRRIDPVVQINRKYGDESLATRRDTQRIRLRLVVSCLFQLENQEETKHVESSLVPRLDEGSSPSSSTMYYRTNSDLTRQTSDYQVVPGFLLSNPFDSGPKKDAKRTSPDRVQALTRH